MFFARSPELSLLPIALSMTQETFKLGDYLIQAGKAPDQLMIIIKGACDLVYQNLPFERQENLKRVRADYALAGFNYGTQRYKQNQHNKDIL